NKSLKRFFIDLKVPLSQRDNTPLITDDENIIWVAGFRISEDYKVKKDTLRILKLKITYL
ncbi:MAG: tRNA lysidine(34) synthetase TilS, partial [Candidatus Kappaea frigidicola]|nr:tRNA lysidine(34) synthetase TilS [Candidatus Kappaea frigidicola]